jgi:DNA-directed RNA polymerase subunit RPC12/RpoP
MSIETCTNCQKQFHLIKEYMDYPVCIEQEKYWCPYCRYEYRKNIRGVFSTEKLEGEKLESE